MSDPIKEITMPEKIAGSLAFPKDDRLHHRSLLEGLFRKGKTFYEFPLRVTWRKLTQEEVETNFRDRVPDGIGKVQVMISVPKKKRKKAVDRVRMRRLIRESYRLNREELRDLLESCEQIRTLSLGFVYIHDKNLPYSTVEEKMKAVLKKLCGIMVPEGQN